MTLDVVALGEPLYELNQQPDGRFLPGFGGDTSNVAIAVARLGSKAGYISKVGNDAPGRALLSLWQDEGIDIAGVGVSDAGPTGLYLVTHGAQGHEFSYYRKGSAASLMTPADVRREHIAGASFLHISAISQAISSSARDCVQHAMQIARNTGTKISYDTNLRLKLWPLEQARSVIMQTAPGAQLIKTSLDDAEHLTGETSPPKIARLLSAGSEAIVVITLGSAGVYVKEGDTEQVIPGRQVHAVDATGAGDAFAGALLAQFCQGRALTEAAVFANAAAALSTQGYGAVTPLPRRTDVQEFLDT